MSIEERASGSPFESSIQDQSEPGPPASDAANVDLQKLGLLAQQAYDQKRTKHCLALTRALLLFDPQNEQAHAIQASIRSDMQRDLQNARALTEDARDLPEKSRQAAEGLLWKILNVDPENEDAKALLSKIKTPYTEVGASKPLAAAASAARAENQQVMQHPVHPEVAETSLDHLTSRITPIGEPQPMPTPPVEAPEIVWSPPARMDWSAMEARANSEALAGASETAATATPSVNWPSSNKAIGPDARSGPSTTTSHAHTDILRPTVKEPPALRLMPEPLELGSSSPSPRLVAPLDTMEPEEAILPEPVFEDELPQTKPGTVRRIAIPIGVAALLVVAIALLLLTRQEGVLQPADTQAAGSSESVVSPVVSAVITPSVVGDANDPFYSNDPLDKPILDSLAPGPSQVPAPPPPVPAPAPVPEPVASAPIANGRLALSAPTSVEIYKDGTYLGSTPISLELPPGSHVLEYRHQDLRTAATHVVKSNETTRSMITFEVAMKINARPWAQVFVDGTSRRSLGQTPLSDVRVPIGSTLVFRHPNFPEKSYRVTGRDTAIQIVFP